MTRIRLVSAVPAESSEEWESARTCIRVDAE